MAPAGGIEGIRIGMERDEHVGMVPAGHLETGAQGHELVAVAGHLDPIAPGGQELALQLLGHGQGDILLIGAGRCRWSRDPGRHGRDRYRSGARRRRAPIRGRRVGTVLGQRVVATASLPLLARGTTDEVVLAWSTAEVLDGAV